MFTGDEITYFAKDYCIQLIISTPFYAQANGQTEASINELISILEKILENNPRDCYINLSETLWAYRTSKRYSTWVSPYSLTYWYDAMLPMEVVVPSLRVSRHNGFNPQEYSEAMIMELEALDGKRLKALNHFMIQNKKVARAYNRRVRRKSFEEKELVWKMVLPIDSKDRELGKWSHN